MAQITQTRSKLERPKLSISIPQGRKDIHNLQSSISFSSDLNPIRGTNSIIKTRSDPSQKPVVKRQCLKCGVLGLRCCYEAEKESHAGCDERCCSRCRKTGEEFCIIQKPIIGEDNLQVGVNYSADGVEQVEVMRKAKELTSAKVESMKWALPRIPEGMREGLKSVKRRFE